MRNGRLVNLIQVGIPLRRTHEALNRYLRTLLALIPLGLGLATAGGALVARRALSPVGAMSWTARCITGVDLTERIPPRGAGDELDHLPETLTRCSSGSRRPSPRCGDSPPTRRTSSARL